MDYPSSKVRRQNLPPRLRPTIDERDEQFLQLNLHGRIVKDNLTSCLGSDIDLKMALSIRSSVEESPFDPPSNSSNGRTRLTRIISAIQTKLNARINELRKNLPLKILFFLVGFYSATAFATVIGQTGDWDVLSAALAVAVVEGIGALMYRASLPLLNKIKGLITMFNYWKAGLSMGLFLDSFKYEMDDIFGLHNLFHLYLENVIHIIY
ncbi:ycf20-like protein isoform X2 [Cucurbita maxima]|uniref:Ycf20-like protein isoform X2 n=1 Tax=Cucurbita maxima TaxID=3661 RepID=A0A6J1KZB0_CUCMA|nr:ycf20-like protein isoform X2 [Cucurbita maxima]